MSSDIEHPEYEFSTIILQASPRCNLRCKYCYLSDLNNKKHMSLDDVKIIFTNIKKNIKNKNNLEIIWHSGEPTLLGGKYFRSAVEILEGIYKDNEVNFGMQTNGTVINRDLIDLFLQKKFHVGISIDGPEKINDLSRVYENGSGSFKNSMKGLEKLLAHGITPSVICVLNKTYLSRPDVYYEFFKELGVRMVSINFPEAEGANSHTLGGNRNSYDDYKNFIEFFLCRRECENSVKILQVENIIKKMEDIYKYSTSLEENIPLRILSVDWKGMISTFSPELQGVTCLKYNDFHVANAFSWSGLDIGLINGIHNEIKDGINKCKSECKYFSLCGGGRPSGKFFHHGKFSVSTHESCLINTMWLIEIISEYLVKNKNIKLN
ncbi:radical SAM protein [Pectobacterium brasiliense]|uniref:radical SAM protein n=1 Tax=Pectobacterium brasiliense TaxID=180957 RepID=UPI002A823C68|nr:radical SAM protein [Pectobacterium brasiliense]MDY4366490.1 radical SAM protein [Pectobacterium brasiliense]MDY7056021.1 radical SAM protein [Pectobacterium brasiliense]